MNDAISICVENLGKLYRIGEREPYKTLRDSLARPFRKWQHLGSPEKPDQYIWALKGVSFKVSRGEVVGIIGGNGAGKSTLLKILSRITEPTEGYAEVFGRVGSLLEIGTGFHPELTGRDNVYLSGAILGMKKREIEDKFEDIVEFAGIEKFISTPVKYYSSGMYVRLAFAIAAHLEPEVLLVDEVLAVGDAAFQKKCLGKMGQVAREGRTVLFVSHNMAAVENLCQRAIVLDQGQVTYIGTQSEAITRYLTSPVKSTSNLRNRKDRQGSGAVRVVDIETKDLNGNVLDAVTCGQDIDVYLYFEAAQGLRYRRLIAGLTVSTQLDEPIFLHHNRLTRDEFPELPESGAFVCRLERLPLPPSTYKVGYSIMADDQYLDSISNATELTVVEGDFYGSGEVPPASHGVCLVEGRWRLESDTAG